MKHIANDLIKALMCGLGNPDLGASMSMLKGMQIRSPSRHLGPEECDRLGARLSAFKFVKDMLVQDSWVRAAILYQLQFDHPTMITQLFTCC